MLETPRRMLCSACQRRLEEQRWQHLPSQIGKCSCARAAAENCDSFSSRLPASQNLPHRLTHEPFSLGTSVTQDSTAALPCDLASPPPGALHQLGNRDCAIPVWRAAVSFEDAHGAARAASAVQGCQAAATCAPAAAAAEAQTSKLRTSPADARTVHAACRDADVDASPAADPEPESATTVLAGPSAAPEA